MKVPTALAQQPVKHDAEDSVGPWRSAVPELAAAGIALLSCAIAAFFLAGLAGAVLVVVIFSVLALGALVLVLPRTSTQSAPGLPKSGREIVWVGSYWRLQAQLKEGRASKFSYRYGLGTRLEHLLAARLSERHGVNLYREPEAARRVLCAKRSDADLWAWVNPARQAPERNSAGIPARTLARLVRRLEQL